MIPGFNNLNYYELLDVSMGVDAKEVQEAYYLVREAFGKNALASYSLYSPEEREEILKLLEEAYHILVDDQARREYDKTLSDNRIRLEKIKKNLQVTLPFDETSAGAVLPPNEPTPAAGIPVMTAPEPVSPPVSAPTVSGGEVCPPSASVPDDDPKPVEPTPPPAVGKPAAPEAEDKRDDDDEGGEGEDEEPLLLDEEIGEPEDRKEEEEEPVVAEEKKGAEETPTEADPPPPATSASPSSPECKTESATPTPPPSAAVITNPAMAAADSVSIRGEVREPENMSGPRRALYDHLRDGVSGAGLKRVREQRGFTLDQAFEVTRIRRPILQSIEEEEYEKLPAVVFLRGMVATYARFLGLPDPDSAAKSYVDRMTGALGAG